MDILPILLVPIVVGAVIAFAVMSQKRLLPFKRLAEVNGWAYRWLPVEGFEISGTAGGVAWTLHHGRRESVGFEARFQADFRPGVVFGVIDKERYTALKDSFLVASKMLTRVHLSVHSVAGLVTGPTIPPPACLQARFVILGDPTYAAILSDEIIRQLQSMSGPLAVMIYDGKLQIEASPIERAELLTSLPKFVTLGQLLLQQRKR